MFALAYLTLELQDWKQIESGKNTLRETKMYLFRDRLGYMVYVVTSGYAGKKGFK